MVAILSACGSEPPPPPPPQDQSPAATQAMAETTATEAPAAMAETATEPAPPTDAPAAVATEAPDASPETAAAVAPSPTDTSEPTGGQSQAPPAPAAPTEAPSAPTAAPTAAAAPPTEAATLASPPEVSEPAAPEGTNIGEIPPAFAMERSDGTPVALADLTAAGRPAFMMYFATW